MISVNPVCQPGGENSEALRAMSCHMISINLLRCPTSSPRLWPLQKSNIVATCHTSQVASLALDFGIPLDLGTCSYAQKLTAHTFCQFRTKIDYRGLMHEQFAARLVAIVKDREPKLPA